MAKGNQRRRTRRGKGQRGPTAVADVLLHFETPNERPWKFLLPVLALAFAGRVINKDMETFGMTNVNYLSMFCWRNK